MDFGSFVESVSENIKVIIVTSLTMLAIVVATVFVTFFFFLSDADQVMVPDIVGKPLEAGLIEMQAKQLFPLIQLRYSNEGELPGTILTQDPAPGSIVKAGKRINLMISRGESELPVPDLVGKNYSDAQTALSGQSILIAAPLKIKSEQEAGTILAQKTVQPLTSAQKPVLHFIISSGRQEPPSIDLSDRPNLSLTKVYKAMETEKLIFDFVPGESEDKNLAIRFASSEPEFIPSGELQVQAELALPKTNAKGDVFGVLTVDLPEFPYLVQVSLDVLLPTGVHETLVVFEHPGKKCTIPYCVPPESELVINVRDVPFLRKRVETAS